MSLGENIARLRAQKNWSQEELAQALDVSRQSVSKWEDRRIGAGPGQAGEAGRSCSAFRWTNWCMAGLPRRRPSLPPNPHLCPPCPSRCKDKA